MTERSDPLPSNAGLAALLLTNRLTSVAAKPYTASEFWRLVDSCDRVDELLTADVARIVSLTGVDDTEAGRIRTLLDASRAFAFERERLEESGIALVSAMDPTFPGALPERLGTHCPTFLLVAGPIDWLSRGGLGVIGSLDASDDELDLARAAARAAVEHTWPVITGLARGIDQASIDTAAAAGGRCVGVPAEGINVVSRRSEIRRLVHDGQLCIASPFAPDSRFAAGAATGRNRIIYALSNVAFVVGADEGTGAAWAGAVDAVDRGWSPVGVWAGSGPREGNRALVRRGAHPIERTEQLFEPLTIAPTDRPSSTLF